MVVSLLCHFNIDVIHRKNGARVLYRVAHSSVSIGFIVAVRFMDPNHGMIITHEVS